MGRSAYWKAAWDELASAALGDANRGAFLALQSAVSTRRRLVATDPPERRASSCLRTLTDVLGEQSLLRPRNPCQALAWLGRSISLVATDPPERRASSCL